MSTRISTKGYRVITGERSGRTVYEHRRVAELAVGRSLPATVQIHHHNEDRGDNSPQNLVVCEDAGYHKLLHMRTAAYRATGDPHQRRCTHCHEWDRPERLTLGNYGSGRVAWHKACAAEKMRRRYQGASA